jgi:hypothetical protein
MCEGAPGAVVYLCDTVSLFFVCAPGKCKGAWDCVVGGSGVACKGDLARSTCVMLMAYCGAPVDAERWLDCCFHLKPAWIPYISQGVRF